MPMTVPGAAGRDGLDRRVRLASMFEPDPLLQAIPWVVAFVLAALGFYWIHRITSDIEDN